ncbi:hypothetical protein NNN99_21245, partial [Kluyvera georgiana]|nr:hypothetical protein [Kluyvera georgiana]
TTVNDFMDSVHHIWCPLSSQEYQDLPDGAETTLTVLMGIALFFIYASSKSQAAPTKISNRG